jgi:hypothetical protein
MSWLIDASTEEVRMAERDEKTAREHGIERVGAGGQVGQNQSGTPLHEPDAKLDKMEGRERVGAGGPIGDGQTGTTLHKPDGK